MRFTQKKILLYPQTSFDFRPSRYVSASDSGLPKDSVANVPQVITVDRTFLTERCGRLPGHLTKSIDDGLRLVLSL
jgi:mRNA-degrading endonuclease toxin of MazEF toxin-antitoxin module